MLDHFPRSCQLHLLLNRLTFFWTASLRTHSIVSLDYNTCNEHPLATASSVFNVVLISLPKTNWIIFLMEGIRVEPPTISTASISSLFNPMQCNNIYLEYICFEGYEVNTLVRSHNRKNFNYISESSSEKREEKISWFSENHEIFWNHEMYSLCLTNTENFTACTLI